MTYTILSELHILTPEVRKSAIIDYAQEIFYEIQLLKSEISRGCIRDIEYDVMMHRELCKQKVVKKLAKKYHVNISEYLED